MKWSHCLLAALCGCSLITDPGSYEGGDAARTDAGTDADTGTDGDLPDGPDPCEGECNIELPYCTEIDGVFQCVECATNEQCLGEFEVCSDTNCIPCDANGDGTFSADPACDDFAREDPRDCDDDGDGFISFFESCEGMSPDQPRDCADAFDIVRPGIAVCGATSYLSCGDPIFELNLDDGFTNGGGISLVAPRSWMATPPPPASDFTFPAGAPPPRAPFDAVVEAPGRWAIAYLSGRDSGEIVYDNAMVQRAAYEDGPRGATFVPAMLPGVAPGPNTYRDIQITRAEDTGGNDTTYLALAQVEAAREQARLFEHDGAWLELVSSITNDDQIRVPMALTSDLAGARVYFRHDSRGVDTEIRWLHSDASSNSFDVPTSQVPLTQGVGLAAAANRVWSSNSSEYSIIDPDCGSCTSRFLPSPGAQDPRALRLPPRVGAARVMIALRDGDSMKAATCANPDDCVPTDISLGAFGPYDIAALQRPNVALVAHESGSLDGSEVLLRTYRLDDWTPMGETVLFRDLANFGFFDTVFAVTIDALETVDGGAEIIIAVLAANTSEAPRIYVHVIRLCG